MDFFYTHISKKSLNLIKQTLKTTFISEGKVVKEFEQGLAKKIGLVNPVAVNSGTAALHLALAVANIGEGDEVIIPPQTFVATGTVVLQQKAKPVFADIQYETGNIEPESIIKKITRKTKAIIPVHWGGYPCDLDEINKIAKKYKLVVIEDAAHALGATYKGRAIGSISQFSAFSFQAIKLLTTADGGALCCLKKNDFQKALNLRWFGIDRANSKPSILGEREYDLYQLGFKYHLNNFAASLGLANLEDFQSVLKKRREIANIYRKELSAVKGISLLDYKNDRESSYWLFTILVEDRENFIKKLKSVNIPSNVVHLRIDKYSIFGGQTKGLKNQDKFNKHQISIPLHSGLNQAQVNKVVKTIKSGW